jgi:hypothetical protein
VGNRMDVAPQTEVRQPSAPRNYLRMIGVVLLVAGLVGMGYWALRAFDASYSATLAEDSIASEVAYVIDWIPKPGTEHQESTDDADFLVIAHDEDGNVIWEGPQDEWGALLGGAESAYQAELRRTWLYPAAAAALAGLLIVVFGRRHTATKDNRT